MSEASPQASTPAPTPPPAPTPLPAPSPPSTPPPPAAEDAPPWGEDFDPARAWKKIQKANAEAAQLRQRVMSPEQEKQLAEYQSLVEASKTEQQRQMEALEAASRERDQYRNEALRFRVAAEHGITKEDIGLLGMGDEEQLKANAARIAELRAAAAAAGATPPPTPQRPTEQLRPGATPAEQLDEDEALYQQIYGTSK